MSFQGRIKLALILADIHDARYDNLLRRIMEAAKEELVPEERVLIHGSDRYVYEIIGFNECRNEILERIEKL